MNDQQQFDIEQIIAHRYDNGGDLWATPDKKLLKGAPFTTLESISYLLELGVTPHDPIMKQTAELIFSVWEEDGRFKTTPTGGIFPCHSAHALKTLCSMGHTKDPRIQKSISYFLTTQQADGGWKCNKYSFGRGPETAYSTPMTTLMVLDAMRYTVDFNQDRQLERAVDFLLRHWITRIPISPCHYGIGTLFRKVAYPFRDYNIFYYVYVLSFYTCAKKDPRFMEAYHLLASKLVDEQVVVERVVPKLTALSFCKKGQPSESATARFHKIIANIAND